MTNTSFVKVESLPEPLYWIILHSIDVSNKVAKECKKLAGETKEISCADNCYLENYRPDFKSFWNHV